MKSYYSFVIVSVIINSKYALKNKSVMIKSLTKFYMF